MPSEASKLPRPEADVIATGLAPNQLPTITFAVDGCVMGHWHSILIGVWAIPSTLETVAELEKLTKLLCASWPKFSSIHLVIKRAPLPGAEVRAAYKEMLRRYSDRLACASLLLEGDGFWASAVRAFLTGILMFERRAEVRTFGHLEPLVEWMAQMHTAETDGRLTPGELRLALEWMLDRPTVREHRGI